MTINKMKAIRLMYYWNYTKTNKPKKKKIPQSLPHSIVKPEWFYKIGASKSIRNPKNDSMRNSSKSEFCLMKCLQIVGMQHIPGRQNKNFKCKITLYRKAWFVWVTPGSSVSPGSMMQKNVAKDLNRITKDSR